MKKTLLICLTLIAIVLSFAACGGKSDPPSNNENNQEENPTEENLNYEFSLLPDGTYAVSRFLDNTATEITIPESYNGSAVTRVMKNAFINSPNLTSITVPKSIKEIDEGAFCCCYSLERLTLPFVGKSRDSLDPLGFIFGKTPYPDAQRIEQQYGLPNNREGYGYDYYYIPSHLQIVIITEGVINRYAFRNCIMIKELICTDDVTGIETGALLGCEGLNSVYMGDGFTEISERCFWYLLNLNDVVIGKNVKTIGVSAFDGCRSLESIIIPYSVTTIEKYAFDGCTGMKEIYFECLSGWYRDYGSASGTGMNVSDPEVNVKNLTDSRKYSSDRWKRR